jgi:hypothetical protein
MANPNTAAFPTSVATDINLTVNSDNAFSALASPGVADGSATTIAFVDNSVFNVPCLIALENEVILARGPISGSHNITNCVRGFLGSGVSHSTGIVGYAYIFSYTVNQICAEIKAIETALGAGMVNIPGTSVGGDLSGTLPDPDVVSVGGGAATASGIVSAVSLKHTQNTDIGTSSATFQIGTSGNKIKDVGTALQIRNSGDSDYANLSVASIATNGDALGGDLTGDLPNPALADTEVAPGTYGNGTQVGSFTVDAKGRITTASGVPITGAAPTGSAGGDITGSYPNPILTTTGVIPGTYGDTTHVASITVDAKGRLSSASGITITYGTASGDLTGPYPSPTIALVGGVTAANVAAGANLANTAVSTATPSTIVIRNPSGDFAGRNITGRIISGNTSPTKSLGAGSGSGSSATLAGNDMAGSITLTTGSAPSTASTIITLTFGTSLSSSPSAVVLSPGNAATAALTTNQPFVSGLNVDGFGLTSNAVALINGITYVWYYVCIG